MASEDSPAQPPQDGGAPRRRLRNAPVFAFLAAGVVAAAVGLGWGLAGQTYGSSSYSVPYQLVSWTAESDREASVTFQVNSQDDAACLLRALDGQHVEVGQNEVVVEAGIRGVTHTVETTRRAQAAEVVSCRAIED